ncbi:MAG: hypothetical protein KAI71_01210 [Candidatus Pacebacteria bacterium]|nr:hypothetical protein [Candidatus Paceibacterota bacterium]
MVNILPDEFQYHSEVAYLFFHIPVLFLFIITDFFFYDILYLSEKSKYLKIVLFVLFLQIIFYFALDEKDLLYLNSINLIIISVLIPLLFLLAEIVSIKLIPIRKKRLLMLSILLIFIIFIDFIVCPFIISNDYKKVYYQITGKIVNKQITVREPALSFEKLCLNNMPSEKCELIYVSSSKRPYYTNGWTCWSCFEYVIDCNYGCPKNFESD